MPQVTLPDHSLLVVQVALLPILTSPDPRIWTVAGPFTSARTLPDPAIDASAELALTPATSISPDPAIAILLCGLLSCVAIASLLRRLEIGE